MTSVFLTGLDGTGKSTLATALNTPSTNNPLVKPVRIHQYDALIPLARVAKSALRDRGVKSKLDPAFKPSTSEATQTRSGVKRLLTGAVSTGWLVAGFSRAWIRVLMSKRRGDDLISDRCFVDEVLRREWSNGSESPLARRLLARSPRPDLFVVLTPADLALSWERKKNFEYDLDGYRRKSERLAEILDSPALMQWNTLRIEVDQAKTAEVVLELVQDRLRSVTA